MAWGLVVLSCLVMDVAMGVVDLRKFRYVIWGCVTSVIGESQHVREFELSR
jgi:hypothetical protein